MGDRETASRELSRVRPRLESKPKSAHEATAGERRGKLSPVRALTACLTVATLLGAPAPAFARVELGDPPLPPVELDWQVDRRIVAVAESAAATTPTEPGTTPPHASDAPNEQPEQPEPQPSPSAGSGTATDASPAGEGGEGRAVPPPTVASATAVSAPRVVAIGLGADAPGSREEWALLDRLERGVLASPEPRAELRRLRTPISAPRRVCRETGADYVISVGYVAQRIDPLLAAWDCELDLELGRWAAAEAEEPGLLASIQDQHDEAITTGEAIAGSKGRPKLPPKVRNGLIAVGVVLALGATLAILLAAGLREDRVILTVRP